MVCCISTNACTTVSKLCVRIKCFLQHYFFFFTCFFLTFTTSMHAIMQNPLNPTQCKDDTHKSICENTLTCFHLHGKSMDFSEPPLASGPKSVVKIASAALLCTSLHGSGAISCRSWRTTEGNWRVLELMAWNTP